ncbi:hypothetical protein C8R43DRAFT_483283 [Mycena crocata]|nr:hypothetical protein C8R43DRAFT_483283 [Mycena crocata]
MYSAGYNFPPELEREIFEVAALMYPKMIPNLLRVAHRVLLWIEPLLYRTILIPIFEAYDGASSQMLRLGKTKPPDFFHHAVKDVNLYAFQIMRNNKSFWSNDDLESVLRQCSGAERLLMVAEARAPPMLPMLEEMRPKQVTLILRLNNLHLDFSRPLFRNVTHLAIGELERNSSLGEPIPAQWHHWQAIFRLPALTHLALGHATPASSVQAMLSAMPRLRVLLIITDSEFAAADFSTNLLPPDDRVVILDFASLHHLDVLAGTRAIDDIWSWANDFVSRKRGGQIDASSHYMPPSDFNFPARANDHPKPPSPNVEGPELLEIPEPSDADTPTANTVEDPDICLLNLDESTHVELPATDYGDCN